MYVFFSFKRTPQINQIGMQAVCGGLRRLLGPKQLTEAVKEDWPTAFVREDFQKPAGLASPPLLRGNQVVISPNLEASQKANAKHRGSRN